jgi:hypothetical protein
MWIPRPMMQRDYDFIVKWFEVCREGLVSERASVRTYKEPQTKKEDDRE